MSCHAMVSHAVPCHAMPHHAKPCHAMLCHGELCHAMPYHAEPHQGMPRLSCAGGSGCSMGAVAWGHPWVPCSWPALTPRVPGRCVRITDTGLSYLSTMSSLRSLYLRWCCQVGGGTEPCPSWLAQQGGQSGWHLPGDGSRAQGGHPGPAGAPATWCWEVGKG